MRLIKIFRNVIVLVLASMSNVVWGVALPRGTLNIEQSNQYGLVINPCYANLLNPTTALGFEIGFGASEFRFGGTWAKILACKHQIKITADYLSQLNQTAFLSGITNLWEIQQTFAQGYSYLFSKDNVSSFNINFYQLYSRDNSLPTIFDMNDTVKSLYRRIRGANGYGASAGMTLLPLTITQIETTVFYDNLDYRNEFEPATDKNGLGVGVHLTQVLHPRIKLNFDAAHRVLYDKYLAQISWLIPVRPCNGLELSFQGQYVTGDLPEPKETRLGIALTYHWERSTPMSSYLPPRTLQETVLASASRPLVRMPQTLVTVDQKVELK